MSAEQARDFAFFAKHLRVADYLTSELVPLAQNNVQRAIRAELLKADKEERPARLIILKARRMGVSTITQATFAHRAMTRRNVHTLTVAHTAESSEYLHGMTETFYRNLPPRLTPGQERGKVGRRLDFAHGSSMRVATAGGDSKGLGRGMGVRYFHGSEVAFWPDAKGALVAVRQTIPRQPGTIIMLESTANGVGDAFHSEWERAKNGASGYVPLFFPWFKFDAYVVPPWFGESQLTSEEQRLVEVYDLGLDQIAWRRLTIDDECGGDLDYFNQEYPEDDVIAFLTSGRRYFGNLTDGFHPSGPIRTGYLDGAFKRGQDLKFVDDEKGHLRIWETRKEDGRRYFVFCDIAGDVTPREAEKFQDKRDVEDYSVAWVVDCSTGATVAVLRDRMDADLFALEAAKLGWLYCKAIICPEMNGGYGNTMVTVLRANGYPAIETHYPLDTYDMKRRAKYGWTTTQVTRPLMLDNLRRILRENPELLRSEELKREMTQFVIGRNGKAQASDNAHDDLVMAAAGAYQGYAKYARRKPLSDIKPRSKPSISQLATRKAQ